MNAVALLLENTGSILGFLALASIAASIACALMRRHWPVSDIALGGVLMVGNVLYGIGAVFLHQWVTAGFSGAMVAILAWSMWRRYKDKRKRAAALVGAKSRALRDALVRKAREAAKPRPVLRPVPGGAR